MDVFDLVAKISLNSSDYDNGLDDAARRTNSFGDQLKSGLVNVGKAVGTAALASVTAAIAGVATLTKTAVEAYSEYEQLAGGVETLFGDAQATVFANAAQAWTTAGVSMNEYMETVTSFAAALKQSVATEEEAAQIADMAIVDMADNANKMGSSMESIQNAYQGFAKQNYTMLDNLKLGYGGTKQEMERLLADATALSGVEYDIESLSDVYSAIHVIQTELGITGTTALEANTTIQGSLSAMQSAWQNVLTGIADENADFDRQIEALVGSVETFAANIVPRIEQALSGVGDLISKLAPIIADKLPGMIEALLPGLLSAITSLLSSVATALPSLLGTIVDALPGIIGTLIDVLPEVISGLLDILPDILQAAIDIVVEVVNGVADMLPELIPDLVNTIVELITTLLSNANGILDAALNLITGLANGILNAIPVLIEALPEVIMGIINFILSAIPQIIQTGITLITSLVTALPQIINTICAVIPDIIEQIVDAVMGSTPELTMAGVELFIALVANLPKIILEINKAIPKIITSIIVKLIELIPQIAQKGEDMLNELLNSFAGNAAVLKVVAKATSIGTTIKNSIATFISSAANWGKDLIDNFISGITSKISALKDSVTNVANTVKDFLGFSEPEKGPLSNFHTYAPDMIDLFTEGIYASEDELTSAISDVFNIEDKMKAPNFEANTMAAAPAVENNVTVSIEGDMAKLFRALIKENDNYSKLNGGQSAFA